MTKLEGLEKRVDKIKESTPPPPSQEDIISHFIDGMPWELRKQVIQYVKDRIHELEGPGSETRKGDVANHGDSI